MSLREDHKERRRREESQTIGFLILCLVPIAIGPLVMAVTLLLGWLLGVWR